MTKFIRNSAPLLLPLCALALTGCSKEPAAPPVESVAAVEEEVVEEVEVPAVDSGNTAASAGDEITAAMASLSEVDRTAALAQKVCPVSDEPLGSMGTPIKLTVAGREVFICCDSCRKPLEEDPDKYLAKLDSPKPEATQPE